MCVWEGNFLLGRHGDDRCSDLSMSLKEGERHCGVQTHLQKKKEMPFLAKLMGQKEVARGDSGC